MSTTNPWLHMLHQLEPEYTTLQFMVEKGPRIITELFQRNKSWCIRLQEEKLPNNYNHIVWENPGKLDERVNWALEQLDTWSDVRRMAHDMWYFKRKHDAEKFQTLYNLKWASE